MFLYDYNNIPITEAYYGKTKELKEIEKELSILIEVIKNNTVPNGKNIKVSSDLNNINMSKTLRNIENLFCKLFNLDEFYLSFYTGIPVLTVSQDKLTVGHMPLRFVDNAYALVLPFNFFKSKKKWNRVDSTGMVMGCCVDYGLIRHFDIEADELLAVILHELGHCMDASIFTVMKTLSFDTAENIGQQLVGKLYGSFIMEIMKEPFFNFMKSIDSFIDENPKIKKFFTFLNDAFANYKTLFNMKIFMDLAKSGEAILKATDAIATSLNPIRIGNTIGGYSMEKYADSFATAYGYGPALSRFLHKNSLEKNVTMAKSISNVPVLNWFYDFTRVNISILSHIGDEHPIPPARIMAQLHKLKKELKDPNIDPRVRKMIMEDIDEMEDYINNRMLNIKDKDNKKNIFTFCYNYTVMKLFKGRVDPRELLDVFNHFE